MRNVTRYFLIGLAILLVDGCTTNSVPPADGIYTGTITTATGTDNIYAIIDSTGAGTVIDTTNASITRFTISSIDSEGNFSAPTTNFAGSGFGVESGTSATSGSISGTLNGDSSNIIGGNNSASRNTITGNIITAIGASQPFTLTYQPAAYEDNVTSLTTIVTPTNNAGAATLSYSYTPPVVTVGVTPPQTTVSLTLSAVQLSSTTNLAYSFTGTDSLNCTYSGAISMPDSSFNAFDLSMTVNCGGTISTRTGLAYVNGTSPIGLTLEYNDGNNFAVAANAALTN